MDLRQLQVFMAVWKTKSFSKAARDVYLTQPTVSGHIKSLEEQLGVRLFDRTGREAVPTRAGERLFPFARDMLNLAQKAEGEMAAFLGTGKGVLDLGGSNIPGQYLLPKLIGDFKADTPQAHVCLKVADTRVICDMVEQGAVELGLVGAKINRPNLAYESCFRDELVLAVPPGHEFAGREEVDVTNLLYKPFVVREEGSGTRLAAEKALEERGLDGFGQMDVVAEMGSTEAVRQAVKAGIGMAIISKRAVEDDERYGAIATCRITGASLHRKFYLVQNLRRTMSPLAKKFMDFVNEVWSKSVM